MLQNRPIDRLVTAACTIALAFAPAFLHADSLGFTQTNLVSDVPGLAANTDPNLKNPWGVAFSATSPFWTSDQRTGLSTLYNAAGAPQSLVVTVPGSATPPTGPTGMVFSNIAGQFLLTNGSAATFIFDNLNGSISGWNGGAGTTAIPMASTPGAIYTGLAQAATGGSNFLYAADSPDVSMYSTPDGPTSRIRHSPASSSTRTRDRFRPVQYPEHWRQPLRNLCPAPPRWHSSPGGYVDEYDAAGNFLKRVATDGALFAPWGIVVAPSSFGSFSNDLLIGNFGNGEIHAYDATTDLFLGTLNGANGQPLINDHLWALETRNGVNGFDPTAVYFAAGINDEANGLFGKLNAITPEPASIFGTATGLIALALARVRRYLPGRARIG